MKKTDEVKITDENFEIIINYFFANCLNLAFEGKYLFEGTDDFLELVKSAWELTQKAELKEQLQKTIRDAHVSYCNLINGIKK